MILCMTNENADIVFLTNTTELNNRLSLALFFLCSFQFRHASIAFPVKKIVGQFTYPNKQ